MNMIYHDDGHDYLMTINHTDHILLIDCMSLHLWVK